MSMIALFFLLISVLGGPVSTFPPAEKDADLLQGNWELTDLVVAPRSEDKDKTLPIRDNSKKIINTVNVDGNKMHCRNGPTHTFTFNLDQTKQPKQIDMIPNDGPFKGIKHVGIYQLDGDNLKICVGDPTKKERPTEFAAPMDSRSTILTLVRKK